MFLPYLNYNRTYVELKFVGYDGKSDIALNYNRTYVELKFGLGFLSFPPIGIIIVLM